MLHRFLTHFLIILLTILAAGFGTTAVTHDFWLQNILPTGEEFKDVPVWWAALITFLLGFYARLQTPLKPFLNKFRSFYTSTSKKLRFKDLAENLALFWSRSATIMIGLIVYEMLCSYFPLHTTDKLSQHLPELIFLLLGYLTPSLSLIKKKSEQVPFPVFLHSSDTNPICLIAKGEEVTQAVRDLTGIRAVIEDRIYPLFNVDATTHIPSVALIGERGSGKSLSAQYLKYLLDTRPSAQTTSSKITFIPLSAWKVSNVDNLLDDLLEKLTFVLSSYSDTTDISLPRSLRKVIRDTDQGFIKKFLDGLSLPFEECLSRIDRRLELVNVKIIVHLLDSDRASFNLSKLQPVFESLSKARHISFLIEHSIDKEGSLELSRFVDHFLYMPSLKSLNHICDHTELKYLNDEKLKAVFELIVRTPRRWHFLRKELEQEIKASKRLVDYNYLIAQSLLKIIHLQLYQFFISYKDLIQEEISREKKNDSQHFSPDTLSISRRFQIEQSFILIEPKPDQVSSYLLDFLLTSQWRNVCISRFD